jgi:hypothetical protein
LGSVEAVCSAKTSEVYPEYEEACWESGFVIGCDVACCWLRMDSGLCEMVVHHRLSGDSFDVGLDLLVDKKKHNCVQSRETICGLRKQ